MLDRLQSAERFESRPNAELNATLPPPLPRRRALSKSSRAPRIHSVAGTPILSTSFYTATGPISHVYQQVARLPCHKRNAHRFDMASVYPYCWVWCCLRNDFDMFGRALEGDLPPQDACYFDDALDRWVLFYELPAKERARILDPALWHEIEAHRCADAPTRVDVGLGPRPLDPAILAALTHRGLSDVPPRGWSRRRMPRGVSTPHRGSLGGA